MNEPAVTIEEQIISLFPALETEVYQGWILKQTSHRMIVCPLYGSLDKNMKERILACEEISRQKSLNCQFRIVEHTHYYLTACLEDNGYKLHRSYIIGERYINNSAPWPGGKVTEKIITENGTLVGIKRQELLYLPDARLPFGVDAEDISYFASLNCISRILVNIPEDEKLLASYREAGFHKAYLYRCYQKEESNWKGEKKMHLFNSGL